MGLLKKKIIGDSALNLVATIVPLGLLQIVVLPLMASRLSEGEYGLALTLFALLGICPSVLGNVANNVRLIRNGDYKDAGLSGDFNVILLAMSIFSFGVLMVGCFLCYEEKTAGMMFVALTGVFWVAREYLLSAYLVCLDYRGVLANNLALSCGYAIGLGLFYATELWELVYFCGYLLAFLHAAKTTSFLGEPFGRTPLFGSVSKDMILLAASSFVGRVPDYADRLLLYPLLGGPAVALYYVATLFGKIISVAIAPVSNVLLSHLSSMKERSRGDFARTMLLGAGASVVGLVIVLLITRPCLNILYPQYVETAMPYVFVVTMASFVSALSSLANPFILRFFAMRWQVVLNAIIAVIYVTVALVLLYYFGLMGFCFGLLLANGVKLIAQIAIYNCARR